MTMHVFHKGLYLSSYERFDAKLLPLHGWAYSAMTHSWYRRKPHGVYGYNGALPRKIRAACLLLGIQVR